METTITSKWLDADYSAYRDIPPSPHRITGILLWVLRAKFSLPDNCRNEALNRFTWNEDVEQSKIVIDYSPLIDYRTIQQRAAISVIRKSWNNEHGALGIGNRYSGGPDEKYAGLLRGTHVISGISQNPLEAEALAEEVYYHLIEYTQAIRGEFNIHKLVVGQLGEATKLEESKEHWHVPITVESMLQPDWIMRYAGALLKTVDLHVSG